MYELKICHLYPDTLNLYGDRGNIVCMQKRMEWRGLKVDVDEICVGKAFNPAEYDIYFIGGGQDFEQSVLLNDLKGEKGKAIVDAVNDEKVFLTICGGYQLLGQYYKTWDGKQCDFLGAIDVHTIGEKSVWLATLCSDSMMPTAVTTWWDLKTTRVRPISATE